MKSELLLKNGELSYDFGGSMLTFVFPRSRYFSGHQSIRRTKNLPWQNNLLEDSLKAAGLSGLDSGTKLHVSNLGVGVSNEDIRVHIELISFI